MFKTHYNSKDFPKQYEFQNPTVLVERAGYVPAKQRIEEFMLAGKRLKDHRASQYDFPDPDNIDFSASDPTRRPGYDLADVAVDGLKTKSAWDKVKSAKDAAEKAKVDDYNRLKQKEMQEAGLNTSKV